MRRRIAAVAVVCLTLGIAGCSPAASARPTIVVTTNILGDVVGELVGDQADVVTLMPPNADPHSFELSAREAARLETAELVVENGLDLEEGIAQHVEQAQAGGVPIVTATDAIEPLGFAIEGGGDALDPHFWTDPTGMLQVVDALEQAVADVDGIDAAVLADAADAYRDELVALDADLDAAFDAIGVDRRVLVTNHHVFGYLAERYDFEIVGAVIPSGTTLASPSAADLADLASAITDHGVPAIFVDATQPDRLAQVLADEASIDVQVIALFTESLTRDGEGAATYLEMMRANAQRIAEGLAR